VGLSKQKREKKMNSEKITIKQICQACFSFIDSKDKKSLCRHCEKKYKDEAKT
jgi:hypothetical protein